MNLEIDTGSARSTHALRPGQTRIGRGPDNDVVIPHDVVSKNHLVVWCDEPGSVRVRDLGSKNGTALNGSPLTTEAALREGDDLVLGGKVHVRMLASVTGSPSVEIAATEEALAHALEHTEAMQWAIERVASLASAPTLQARYRYLVAEARRQLDPGPGNATPVVWVLQWSQEHGATTPTFSALVHDHDPVDVPSPADFASSIVGRTMEAGLPTWSDDARADERLRSESVLSLRLRSVGCIPIGRTAVLYVSDPRERGAFSKALRLRLEALCELAAQLEAPAVVEDTQQPVGIELLPGLVGRSQAMRDIARQVRAFARFSWNVLILGEPGTGKTAVARAIHELSGREGPIVHVNCATLTESLAASELFGAARGAYNDARDRPGYVGHANGGTLFLDEVGELPRELQSTLLLLTREGTYHRVGEEETTRRFSGRILAATNRSLDALRPDLAERLMECAIEMPPLADRREDVPDLARLFLQQLCEVEADAVEGGALTFTDGALDLLASGPLEGNVARLKSHVQRGFMWAVVEGADQVHVRHLTQERSRGGSGQATPETFEDAVHQFKRQLLLEALERNEGNKTRTADDLGMTNRQQLIRQLKKVGLMEG